MWKQCDRSHLSWSVLAAPLKFTELSEFQLVVYLSSHNFADLALTHCSHRIISQQAAVFRELALKIQTAHIHSWQLAGERGGALIS